MEIQAYDQKEAKNQPNEVQKTEKREIIEPRPLQMFEILKKTKLHIHSQRKVKRRARVHNDRDDAVGRVAGGELVRFQRQAGALLAHGH